VNILVRAINQRSAAVAQFIEHLTPDNAIGTGRKLRENITFPFVLYMIGITVKDPFTGPISKGIGAAKFSL
jgi:hypothetical protein